MTARILAVTGTDTGAGKTVLAAAIAAALRARGRHVAALKPVATGVIAGEAGDDATLLAAATGVSPADCVLATFVEPRSPLAAASAEARSIDVEALAAAVRERARAAGDVLVVEGVGGVLVPLDERSTVLDLLRDLDAPVVVAARAGLGTLNHTALTVRVLRDAGVDVVGVALVDTDGDVDAAFATENAAWITRACEVPVLGVLRHLADPTDVGALRTAVEADLDLGILERALDEARSAGELIALDRRHLWHPFTQTSEWLEERPPVVHRAEGCWLVDEDGHRLLDGVASLWANVHGHAHPVLDRALREQAGRMSHSTFLGQTHEPGARLAAELAAVAPAGLDRVFLSESGASAVEVALRVALLAHRHRGDTARTRLVSLEEAYHGDTAGAVSVGRSSPFHDGLEPLLVDVLRVPPPHLVARRDRVDGVEAERRSLDALRRVLDEHGRTVAAVVVEPRVQGAAGIWPHSDAWLREAAALTRAAGALLVCDEVATGFGRTGDLFACAGAGVVPDVMTVGKGLSGGYLPISATLVGDEIFDLFTAPYTDHRTLYYGHTYTANPLACAVARASLRLFAEEDTVERGRRAAARLHHRLEEVASLPHVAEVRTRGVMCGVELAADGVDRPFDPALRTGRAVCLAARRRGVVLRPLGDVVVVNPPLVISDAEVDLLVDALAGAVVEVCAARTAVAAAPARGR